VQDETPACLVKLRPDSDEDRDALAVDHLAVGIDDAELTVAGDAVHAEGDAPALLDG